jgi:single-strand DNA-binding protein
MAGEPIITVTGNLGADPELRATPSGVSVTSFAIANTPRVKKNNEWTDGETLWFRCFVWGKDSASAANELRKGTRVFVTGRFAVDNWVDKEGQDRKTLSINVDEFGIVPRNVPEPVTLKHDKPIEDPVDDPWSF